MKPAAAPESQCLAHHGKAARLGRGTNRAGSIPDARRYPGFLPLPRNARFRMLESRQEPLPRLFRTFTLEHFHCYCNPGNPGNGCEKRRVRGQSALRLHGKRSRSLPRSAVLSLHQSWQERRTRGICLFRRSSRGGAHPVCNRSAHPARPQAAGRRFLGLIALCATRKGPPPGDLFSWKCQAVRRVKDCPRGNPHHAWAQA